MRYQFMRYQFMRYQFMTTPEWDHEVPVHDSGLGS